jgi:hypothetical protein
MKLSAQVNVSADGTATEVNWKIARTDRVNGAAGAGVAARGAAGRSGFLR